MNNNTIKYKNTNNDLEDIFPKNWNCKRIKQIFYEIDERSTSGKEDLLSVSQYTGVTLRKENREDQEYLTNAKSLKNYKIVRENDLIINIMLAWNGSLGISKYYGITSPAYCIYRTYDNFDPNFFGYLFSTNLYKNEFKKNSYGIIDSRLRMYSNNFFNITAFYPSLSAQKEIVNFLDKKCEQINQFIADKKQLINFLKEQRQSVIDEILVPNSDDWVLTRLKNIVEINKNVLPENTSKNYDLQYIDIGNVDSNGNIAKLQHLKFGNAPSRARRIVKYNDILISTVRTYLRAITINKNVDKNIICSTGYAVLQTNELILPELLIEILRTERFISKVVSNSVGVSYPAITPTVLGTLELAYPKDINVQKEIIAKIKSETKTIDETIFKTEEELRLVAEYKEALISNAVTGQLAIA